MRVSPASALERKTALVSALKRFDEKIATAEANAKALSERSQAYDELQEVLEDLPQKVQHPIMVPFGPNCFFEGYLHHTNEVTVQLSSDYVVLKTAKGACATAERRKARLQSELSGVNKEIAELRMQRRLAAGEEIADDHAKSGKSGATAAGIDMSNAPTGTTAHVDDDGFIDLREPLLESELSPKNRAQVEPPHPPARSFSDMRQKLLALEAQDDEEDGDDAEEEEEEPRTQQQPTVTEDLDALFDKLKSHSSASKAEGGPPAAAPVMAKQKPSNASTGDGQVVTGDAPPAPAAAATQTPGLQQHPTSSPAFTGAIRERSTQQFPAAAEEASAPPARVSRFKAERQRAAKE